MGWREATALIAGVSADRLCRERREVRASTISAMQKSGKNQDISAVIMRLTLNIERAQMGQGLTMGSKPEDYDEGWILRTNIARYKRRLKEKLPDGERRIVERLLSEEQGKLHQLEE